ncbi:MAG TPA: MFS transporter, partial [Steroidobacteraceae bacterium]
MRKVAGYQDGLAVLLGLTFGVVMFDRGAINFLAPFIVTDLKLSNAQLGIAASVVSLTWALAGCLIGRASDGSGQRKPYLILAVIAFSLCSIASGFAGSFVMLVAFRLLMGLGDGVVPPMTTALLFDASSAHRRGLNFGIYAFFTGLVGGFLAPPIIVALATQFNWRIAFFLAGIPGLLAAAAIALFVRETSVPRALAVDASRRMPPSRLRDVLRGRNIRLCALSASLLLAFQIVMMVFLPLFLVRERHLSPSDMGIVMSAVGAAMLAGGLALPALSDRFGRRTVLAASAVLGATLPLTCLYWTGHLAGLAALCAVAGFAGALPHIAIGIVPAES